MKQIPNTLKDIQEILQKGIDEGITYSKESLDRAKIQFEDIEKNCDAADNDQEKCPFYKMFSYGSNDMRKKAKLIIKHKILPAYKSLFEFIYNGSLYRGFSIRTDSNSGVSL